MKELEGRMRAVEQAVRSIEDERWRTSDPEKSARADDMVAKLEAAIAKAEADLEKARAAGNDEEGRRARGRPHLPPVLPRHGQAGQRRLQLSRPTRPTRESALLLISNDDSTARSPTPASRRLLPVSNDDSARASAGNVHRRHEL